MIIYQHQLTGAYDICLPDPLKDTKLTSMVVARDNPPLLLARTGVFSCSLRITSFSTFFKRASYPSRSAACAISVPEALG